MDPLVIELLNLILHQADEWRYDNAQPAAHRRGKLVAQTLPRTRWHDAENIASGKDILNHFALRPPEFIQPEERLKLFLKIKPSHGMNCTG
jgi:hypothetical protein